MTLLDIYFNQLLEKLKWSTNSAFNDIFKRLYFYCLRIDNNTFLNYKNLEVDNVKKWLDFFPDECIENWRFGKDLNISSSLT